MFIRRVFEWKKLTNQSSLVPNEYPSIYWIIVLLATGKQDIYWIGFVSDFGLYRRQTSQEVTIFVKV